MDNIENQLFHALKKIDELDNRLKQLEPPSEHWDEDATEVVYFITAQRRLKRLLAKNDMKVIHIQGGKRDVKRKDRKCLLVAGAEEYTLATPMEKKDMIDAGMVSTTTISDLIDQFNILGPGESLEDI